MRPAARRLSLLACWLAIVLLTPARAAGPAHAVTPERPLLTIVIDDIGYRRAEAEALIRLPLAITFAVLPESPHGRAMAQRAWRHGREVILHIPMATQTGSPLDPGGIDTRMPVARIRQLLQGHLSRYPEAVGINNHMGSRLTEMATPMTAVMQALKAGDYYFIDSRTSPASQAYRIARQQGIESISRDVFLDNDASPDAISRQLDLALARARQQGHALAIGHPYPATLAVLQARASELASRYQLVPASQLVNLLNPENRELHHKTNPFWQVKRPWQLGSER